MSFNRTLSLYGELKTKRSTLLPSSSRLPFPSVVRSKGPMGGTLTSPEVTGFTGTPDL